MKSNYNNTYFTAFYGIRNNILYTAVLVDNIIFPTSPVEKTAKGTYDYIRAPRSQDFVDTVLNDFFVIVDDSINMFSITLKKNEVAVCSDGEMMVAFSHSKAMLDYATKRIYENLDQFQKPYFTVYHEELKKEPKRLVRF